MMASSGVMAAGVGEATVAVAGWLIEGYVRSSVVVGGCVGVDCAEELILHRNCGRLPAAQTLRQLVWRLCLYVRQALL